jgi:hypothetical protein
VIHVVALSAALVADAEVRSPLAGALDKGERRDKEAVCVNVRATTLPNEDVRTSATSLFSARIRAYQGLRIVGMSRKAVCDAGGTVCASVPQCEARCTLRQELTRPARRARGSARA